MTKDVHIEVNLNSTKKRGTYHSSSIEHLIMINCLDGMLSSQ